MRNELIRHIIDTITGNECMHEFEDLHHEAFNADYYVIGYYNAERIVNLYVYYQGQDILNEFDLYQSRDDVLTELREALTD